MAGDEPTVPSSTLGLPANLAISPHFFFRCGVTEAIIIVVFAFYEGTDTGLCRYSVFHCGDALPSAGSNRNVNSGSGSGTHLNRLFFYDYCIIMFQYVRMNLKEGVLFCCIDGEK